MKHAKPNSLKELLFQVYKWLIDETRSLTTRCTIVSTVVCTNGGTLNLRSLHLSLIYQVCYFLSYVNYCYWRDFFSLLPLSLQTILQPLRSQIHLTDSDVTFFFLLQIPFWVLLLSIPFSIDSVWRVEFLCFLRFRDSKTQEKIPDLLLWHTDSVSTFSVWLSVFSIKVAILIITSYTESKTFNFRFSYNEFHIYLGYGDSLTGRFSFDLV